ncbi:ABC transporter ATP-binding protein [Halococcus agarilyticus]|uniref:ABC transporter ATP-binding protein n=1 Tax=Halococcus agarilyticus TaxID=1232219 RepID=UPI000677D3BC|nr:ABC transporter ATP-binding protein [Halococcus agarilyticus]
MATTTTALDDSTDADPIFEVRNATVQFDSPRGVSTVLDNVSIDIQRGETLGIVGESGSGKSMFADALLDAVVEPGTLSGDVRYRPEDGEPVDVLDLSASELRGYRWEEVSMVFQGAMSSFNPTMRIREHFAETLSAHGSDRETGLERARTLLTDLYLEPDRVMGSYPHELSGGMRQRTLIALSLVLKPEVLVMDEPTAALDLLMQRSILTLLEDIKAKYDITLVFITHDLPLVAHLADRMAVLYAFEFAELGRTDDILRHAAHPYTRALLSATPNIDAPLDEMRPIGGSSPDPVTKPDGCSYHPRCPLADPECRAAPPRLESAEEADHAVACYHWEDAADDIQLPYQGGDG